MTKSRDDDRNFVRRIQSDPIYHIEKVQGVETLEDYQRRTIKTIYENPFTAIRAVHSIGKTWLLAKIVLAFGSSFPNCKIITTAPSWLQVEMLLWSEIRHGYATSKYPLGGRMLNTEWKIDNNWFALGLSPRDDADSSGGGQGKTSGFQGFHAPDMLIIFDEATGVPSKRWIQAHGMTTSGRVHFVAVGNPTTKNCDFAKCFTSRSWAKVHLSCFDSPNLKANGIRDLAALEAELELLQEMGEEAAQARMKSYIIIHTSLLTLQWVMDRALVWGIEHPLFQSKVLGNFPEDDENGLFTLGAIEEAQRRKHTPVAADKFCLGVDVGRFGPDRSVLTPLHGLQTFEPTVLVKSDTTVVSGEAVRITREAIASGIPPNKCAIIVDGTGLGAGVVDGLNQAQREGYIDPAVEIREVHFAQTFDQLADEDEKEYAKTHYSNLKAKVFVDLSGAIKKNLALDPNVSAYAEELPTVLYFLDSKGRQVIESKEDYKKRTGGSVSPDFSDSLALAYFGRTSLGSEVGTIRILRS